MAQIISKRLKYESQPTSPEYILKAIRDAGISWDYTRFCEELGLANDHWALTKFQSFQIICYQLGIIQPDMLEMVYEAVEGNLEDAS